MKQDQSSSGTVQQDSDTVWYANIYSHPAHNNKKAMASSTYGIGHKIYSDRILGIEFYPKKYLELWPFCL